MPSSEATARGGAQPFVPAAPIAARIRAVMRETGISGRQFSTLAGTGNATTARILNGDFPRVRAGVARRILAVTEEKALAAAREAPVPGRGDLADATGTRRRLQALAAEGWSAHALAERLSYASHLSITRLRDGRRKQVAASTRQAVADLYRELDGVLPPCGTRARQGGATAVRQLAAERGWAPREAWDAGEIDDPDAEPRTIGGTPTAAETAAEARFLLSYGDSEEAVAARLGITREHMRELLRRHPETDEKAAA